MARRNNARNAAEKAAKKTHPVTLILAVLFFIAGAAGGAFCGLTHVVCTAFVFGSVTTFPAFVSQDAMNFAFAMIGMLIATVVGAVLGFIFTGKDDQLA